MPTKFEVVDLTGDEIEMKVEEKCDQPGMACVICATVLLGPDWELKLRRHINVHHFPNYSIYECGSCHGTTGDPVLKELAISFCCGCKPTFYRTEPQNQLVELAMKVIFEHSRMAAQGKKDALIQQMKDVYQKYKTLHQGNDDSMAVDQLEVMAKVQASPAPSTPVSITAEEERKPIDFADEHPSAQFQCSFCNFSCEEEAELVDHCLDTHIPFPTHGCPKCTESKFSWTEFLVHLKKEHKGKGKPQLLELNQEQKQQQLAVYEALVQKGVEKFQGKVHQLKDAL